MSLNNVCRMCLTMDVPMQSIADSPLRDVFEKLTNISLNTPHRPVAACYICCAQLRNCHNVMVRSLRAESVLLQMLLSDNMVKGESFAMLNHELHRCILSMTPITLIAFTCVDQEPQLSPYNQEGDIDRLGKCNYENDTRGELLLEEINEGAIKQEEIEEERTESEGYLKLWECEDDNDTEEELRVEIDGGIQEEVDPLHISTPIDYIGSKEITDGDNMESQTMVNVKSVNSKGAAATEKFKQQENVQDTSTLTPDRKNIFIKPRARSTVEEDGLISKNKREIRGVDKEQVSINTGMHTDTRMNKICVKIGSNNDCISTNTDADNTGRKHIRRTFICNNCGSVFDDKYVLIEHIKTTNHKDTVGELHTETHSDLKCCECEICEKKFRYENSLKEHLDFHAKGKCYECDICKNRFSQKSTLRKHLDFHARGKCYKCDICKNSFIYESSLKRHLNVHINEKRYECDKCESAFSHKSKLMKHLNVHAKGKRYECEICKSSFTQRHSLKLHAKVHTKEKPYECHICKVGFSQNGNLKRHMRRHTGEKPYKCEICEREFIQKVALNKHYRTHTKPVKCHMCEMVFVDKKSLRLHGKDHVSYKPYECEICKFRSPYLQCLKEHFRIHTKEKPFQCDICSLAFSQAGNLKRHMRIHTGEKPHKCDICNKKFIQKVCLDAHFRTHTGETPYECEICNKRFSDRSSVKVHLRIHTGEKPYECGICKVRFARSGSLKSHLKIHSK